MIRDRYESLAYDGRLYDEIKHLESEKEDLEKQLKVLQQENKQLKEELERSMKANVVLDNTNTDYASIIFELEEWLKEPEYFNGRKLRQDYITVMTTDVLDKIQKLKEKYK